MWAHIFFYVQDQYTKTISDDLCSHWQNYMNPCVWLEKKDSLPDESSGNINTWLLTEWPWARLGSLQPSLIVLNGFWDLSKSQQILLKCRICNEQRKLPELYSCRQQRPLYCSFSPTENNTTLKKPVHAEELRNRFSRRKKKGQKRKVHFPPNTLLYPNHQSPASQQAATERLIIHGSLGELLFHINSCDSCVPWPKRPKYHQMCMQ